MCTLNALLFTSLYLLERIQKMLKLENENHSDMRTESHCEKGMTVKRGGGGGGGGLT